MPESAEIIDEDASSDPLLAGRPSGAAIGPLRGLLELARLVRRRPTPLQTLEAVAETIAGTLGFRTVAINSYRPETDDYEVVVVRGSRRARQVLLGDMTAPSSWEPVLDDRFRRHGVYFIPAGSVAYDDPNVRWYHPDPRAQEPLSERDWHPEDALFAALDGTGDRRYGIISVDEPASGRRPDDHELELLGALAAHAALAIESALQVTALERALARNRAVIDGTLDCVIAVDRDDRIVEFNPAAERTFGHSSAAVIGRRASELLVAPGEREVFTRVAARVHAEPGSSLLGRRIEATAVRRDGTEFPVELTVTEVQGGQGGEQLFYSFVRDITDRRRSEEQLSYMAYHDALTGLPNRTLVEQELDLALARARRAGTSVALMFVDLDDFKDVNDRLGHVAGDRLLAGVAQRLRAVLRETDLLARQGGDEFLVVLADLEQDARTVAADVCAKLLTALQEPFAVTGTPLRTGASIGVSIFPDDTADTEGLLRHADAAMYRAKRAGGGSWCLHRAKVAN